MSSVTEIQPQQQTVRSSQVHSVQFDAVRRERWEELRAAAAEAGCDPDKLPAVQVSQPSRASVGSHQVSSSRQTKNSNVTVKTAHYKPSVGASSAPPATLYKDAKRLRYTGKFVLETHNDASQRVGTFATKAMDNFENVKSAPSDLEFEQKQAADEARLRLESMHFNSLQADDFRMAI